MTLRWTSFAKDKFFAPLLSQFKTADIPEITGSSGWVECFVLSGVFRGQFSDPMRQYLFNFLRRVENAADEYALARASTITFLEQGPFRASEYLRAVYHWENFAGAAWNAYTLMAAACGMDRVFEKGAGDDALECLNAIRNVSEHADSRIKSGQMPEAGTMPIWLTDLGLEATDSRLTFEHASEILRDLLRLADLFVDPATAHTKALAAVAGDGESQPMVPIALG